MGAELIVNIAETREKNHPLFGEGKCRSSQYFLAIVNPYDSYDLGINKRKKKIISYTYYSVHLCNMFKNYEGTYILGVLLR